MFKISFFITMYFFIISGAVANPAAPREVTELVSQFKIPTVDCPEKIWSGFDWKSLVVVLIYPQSEDSWVWDVSKDELKSVKNSTLDSGTLGSTYNFFMFDGKKAMSLDMSDEDLKNDDQLFKFGAHEFFHYAGQGGWKNRGSSGRGTVYPVSWQPRLYRRMMFDHLKNFFIENKLEDLQSAKFWFEKWSREHVLETQMATDRFEGSATYAESVALAVSQLGCQADDQILKAQVMKNLMADDGFAYALDGDYFSLDSEGYPVGGLASLILRFSDIKLADWNAQIEDGKSPLEILFEGVQSVESTPPPEKLVSQFQATGVKTNQKYASALDPAIKAWKDKKMIRVPFISQYLQSNLRPQFFAFSAELNKELFPLSVDHLFLSPDYKTNLKIHKGAVIIDDFNAACRNAYSYAMVPEEKIQVRGKELQVNSDSVVGTMQGSQVISKEGYKYLCPVDVL